MKSPIFSLALIASLFIGQSAVALGQSGASWSTLQAIGTNERLVVKKRDGRTIEGKMIEASDTNLSIERGKNVVNIPRTEIQSVWHARSRAAKAKWTAIGAAIGAGAGAAVGAAKYDDGIDDSELWIPVGLVFGAGIGAVGGLAFGASRRDRELVYLAP